MCSRPKRSESRENPTYHHELGKQKEERLRNGTPHSSGIPRSLDRAASVGAAPFWRKDLTGRKL